MKLFEYQAKELFKEAGIAVPRGRLVSDVSEVDGALEEVGLPCAIKAQVLRGGRGKAGLIQLATTASEARTKAGQVFDSIGDGRSLLVERALDIEKELYLSITPEPVSGSALILASAEGGVEIEEFARTTPEKIVREHIDLSEGLLPYEARNVMFELGLEGDGARQGAAMLLSLYDIFQRYDAELVEINPLAVSESGALVAVDGKVTIDDGSLARQSRFPLSRDYFESDVEYEAAAEGIPYIEFDGAIGLMCAGSGLTNVIYDLVNYGGGSVGSYVEFGGPNYRRAAKAMELTMLSKPRVLLVVTFGTIARADVIAEDLAEAIGRLQPDFPIVTAIRGTGEEKVRELLDGAGLEFLDDTEDAVERAIELAGGDKG
ncbi:MAG TPA: ATP-grasp domain-containing protein [Rubrobacteraceae bacterium]|nr:ATP-grasp domain-containing protein [Rubrobacteraceae bacterium]